MNSLFVFPSRYAFSAFLNKSAFLIFKASASALALASASSFSFLSSSAFSAASLSYFLLRAAS